MKKYHREQVRGGCVDLRHAEKGKEYRSVVKIDFFDRLRPRKTKVLGAVRTQNKHSAVPVYDSCTRLCIVFNTSCRPKTSEKIAIHSIIPNLQCDVIIYISYVRIVMCTALVLKLCLSAESSRKWPKDTAVRSE